MTGHKLRGAFRYTLHQSRSTGEVQQEERQEKSKCNTEDCSCDDEGSTVISSAIFQLSGIIRAVMGTMHLDNNVIA